MESRLLQGLYVSSLYIAMKDSRGICQCSVLFQKTWFVVENEYPLSLVPFLVRVCASLQRLQTN
jgi:hypothetical protein